MALTYDSLYGTRQGAMLSPSSTLGTNTIGGNAYNEARQAGLSSGSAQAMSNISTESPTGMPTGEQLFGQNASAGSTGFNPAQMAGVFSNLGNALSQFAKSSKSTFTADAGGFTANRLPIQHVQGQDASSYLNQLLQMYQQRQAQGSQGGYTQALRSMQGGY